MEHINTNDVTAFSFYLMNKVIRSGLVLFLVGLTAWTGFLVICFLIDLQKRKVFIYFFIHVVEGIRENS